MQEQAPLVYWGLPQPGSPPKACLITNPAAGPTREKPEWTVVTDLLRDAGWWTGHRETEGHGSAGAIARQAVVDGCKLVVVAGGDGTINEAVQHLVGSEAVLGIIPVGTANVLARELGIPLDPLEATKAIIHGRPRPMDLGMATRPGAKPRYFCEMVGIGFDAAMIHGILPEVKQVLGKGAYVLGAFHASITHRPARMRLTIDGKRMRRLVFLLVVSNTGLYGSDFLKITPEAAVDDGVFNVAIFRGANPFMAWYEFIFGVALKKFRDMTDVQAMVARKVEIKTARPVPVQIDGDAAGTTPVTIEVVTRAIKVMVP